jgi:hypothetical protein
MECRGGGRPTGPDWTHFFGEKPWEICRFDGFFDGLFDRFGKTDMFHRFFD